MSKQVFVDSDETCSVSLSTEFSQALCPADAALEAPCCDLGGCSAEPLVDAQEEEIRELAYRKWQAAGCPTGDGFDFWVDAEREVTAARKWINTLDL